MSERGAVNTSLAVGITLTGAIVAVGLWLGGVGGDEEGIDPAQVVEVTRRDLLDAVTASGRVEPLARVAVMSRASGIIKEVLVEEGDVVEQGQVLAELDREQLEAELQRDEANLASAQARVAAAEARLAEARVRLDDPELEFARREVQRLSELRETGDVTLREADDAEYQLEAVEFRIEQVRANVPVLEAALDEARANLQSATASRDQSAEALREATIRCPIDGVVLERLKEVGDGVSSILTAGGNATQMMTLGDLSNMYIDARVDEVDLGRIHVGMPAVITVDAFRGRTLRGEVERIAPSGTVDNNGIVTFAVRVTVEDPDGLLRPDMTADAKLVLAERNDALTLPHRALTRTPEGGWTVERVVGETTETVAVETGLSDGLMTEIVSGLEEGDRVVLPSAPPSFGGR